MEHARGPAEAVVQETKPDTAVITLDAGQGQAVEQNAFFDKSISGLDTELGLRRAMGMKDFYISMLCSFVQTRRSAVEQIRAALNLHDRKAAEYLSHSLVGMSAQLGAVRVPEDAQNLENAIVEMDSSEPLEKLLQKLEHSLAELVDGMDCALPLPAKAPV